MKMGSNISKKFHGHDIEYFRCRPIEIFKVMKFSNFPKSVTEVHLYFSGNVYILSIANPAGTQHQNDVVSTSMRRDHVASTLIRRHFNVVCPLGIIALCVLFHCCFKHPANLGFKFINETFSGRKMSREFSDVFLLFSKEIAH